MQFTEEELKELVEQISRKERAKLFWKEMAKVFLIVSVAVLASKGLQTICDDSKK